MCDFCIKHPPTTIDDKNLFESGHEWAHYILTDGENSIIRRTFIKTGSIKGKQEIKYCPMCGRKFINQ